MFNKPLDAKKAIAMSLAALVTGLTFGDIAQLADSEYSRVESMVKMLMQQQVASATLATRSGAVQT